MVREVAVLAVVCAGLLALLQLQGAHRLPVLAGLLGCLAAPLVRSKLGWVPWPVITVPVLVAVAAAVLAGRVAFDTALVLGLVYLLLHRSLARAGPADDRMAWLLSTLMLILGASRTQAPLFLLPFGLWLLSTPVVLMLAQLEVSGIRRGRRGEPVVPLGIGAVAALPVLAVLLFLAIPRLGAAPSRGSAGPSVTGFEAETALGDLAVLLDDPSPVFRATLAGPISPPLYFRGTAFDQFDGRRWTSGTPRRPHAPGDRSGTIRLVIEEEAVVENVLFTVGTPVDVEVDAADVVRDEDGNWWTVRVDAPLRYTVWAVPDPEPTGLGAEERVRLTAPLDGTDEVQALADEITAGAASDAVRARAIRAFLLREYTYTRAPGGTAVDAPLSEFLFETRAGHCEYFATAMVVLLRAKGVPSRLVNGFVGGEYNEFGGYWLVRRSHAHSWAEFFAEGRWWTIDATPAPAVPTRSPTARRFGDAMRRFWDQQVIGYDLGVQTRVVFGWGRTLEAALVPGAPPPSLPWLGLLLELLAVGAAAVGSVHLARRLFRRLAGERRPTSPRGRVATAHARARHALERKGWRIPTALPPVDAARWVRMWAGEEAEALERLAWLYYEVRYGGADDGALAAEAQALADRTAALPPPPEG
jgi:transglutaminase-like putative cysteine protease